MIENIENNKMELCGTACGKLISFNKNSQPTSSIEFVEPILKVVIYSENEELRSKIESLNIPSVQITRIKSISDLLKFTTSNCVNLVVMDLKDKSTSEILNICYETRKNSQNVVSFAFFCYENESISWSEKIYAGSAIQLDESDTDDTIKDKLKIALYQCQTETVSVLILQDKKKGASAVSTIANSCGIRCGITENLHDLIIGLESFKPHMIFLDCDNKSADLYKAGKEIREKAFDIPVIAKVSSDLDEPKTLLLNAGIDEIVQSPISTEELMSCIRMQLRYSVLRSKYVKTRSLGRFLELESFKRELNDLLIASREIDSSTAVATFRITNLNEIKEKRGILTATLCVENLKELVKSRFRLKDLIAIKEEGEIIFAFPDIDKDLAIRVMIDLEAELAKFKLSQSSDSLKVKVQFHAIDSTGNEMGAADMIEETSRIPS